MKHAQHKPTSSATASHEAQPAKPAHRPGHLSATPAWAQGRPPAIQAQEGPVHRDRNTIRSAAARGIADEAKAVPYADKLQKAFGKHDVGSIIAHQGPRATDACRAMGAAAYTQGDHVAFGHQPSLHTAAHEAAHVVQQRNGVSIPGGVGQVGDAYERQADAVADAVVSGRPAEGLLDQGTGSQVTDSAPTSEAATQSQAAPVQMEPATGVAIASLVVGIIGTLIGAGSAAYTVAQAKNDEVTGGVEETLDFGGKFFITSLHRAYLQAIGEALLHQKLDELDPGWDTREESDYLQQAKTATEILLEETMADKVYVLVGGTYVWRGDDTHAGGDYQPGGGIVLAVQNDTSVPSGVARITVYGHELTVDDFPGLRATAERHGLDDVNNTVPYLERIVLDGEGYTGEGLVEDDQCYVRPGIFTAGRQGREISITGQFYIDWDENTTRMAWEDSNSISHTSVPAPAYEDGPPDT